MSKTVVLMFCRNCDQEIVYRRAGLVHAATMAWRCRVNSAVKTVASIGRTEDLTTEEGWADVAEPS